MINNPHPGRILILLLLFLLLNMVFSLHGQETRVVRDLHLWTGVQLEKTLAKDWTISLSEEIRFKKDVSELNNYFTDLGLEYRINRNFSLQGNYRFTRDRKKDLSFENLSRYNFDLKYKGKLDFLTVKYRLRYQKEVEGFRLYDQNIPFEKHLRHRLTLKINSMKIVEPYMSGEVFHLFRPTRYPVFEYVRLQAGVLLDLKDAGEVKAAWGFNRELGSAQPLVIYMFRLNYTYKL